jgi:hypothetical protein
VNGTNSKTTSKRPKFDGVCITKQTLDKLLRQPRSDDIIALYLFYSYTAMWQGTNQPYATVGYVDPLNFKHP